MYTSFNDELEQMLEEQHAKRREYEYKMDELAMQERKNEEMMSMFEDVAASNRFVAERFEHMNPSNRKAQIIVDKMQGTLDLARNSFETLREEILHEKQNLQRSMEDSEDDFRSRYRAR